MNKELLKRRIAYILSLVMMLSVCNNVWATELKNQVPYNTSIVNRQTTTDTAEDEGINLTTQQAVHIIKTVDELKAAGEHLDWRYQLANDIDLNGEEWQPIGSEETPFTGEFDGDGHNIINLKINNSTSNYMGLFGVIDNATIKNLILSKVNVVGRNGVGGLVGYAKGNSKEIVNCHIISGEVSGRSYVGGLIGDTSGSSEIDNYYVKGCSTNITVRGEYGYAGGLIGWYRGSISDCYATGDVIGGNDDEQSSKVGGLIGYCTGYSSYENNGYHYYSTSNIVRCYATGNVKGTASVGGLIGSQFYGITTQCAATGSVVGTTKVGGLIGEAYVMSREKESERKGYWHYNVLENSYALGSVTGTSYVAGIVGYNLNTIAITNCYAAGKVEGIDNAAGNFEEIDHVGGLIGSTDDVTITRSYYDSAVTQVVSRYNSDIARLTSVMKRAFTFNEWDFESIWDIRQDETYPYLRNLPCFEGLTGGNIIMEGLGTIENPYIIRTAEQLSDINLDLAAYYKLGNDIDLEEMPWIPIGTDEMPFTGTLDGDGHKIINLKINNPRLDYMGLFGVIKNATIKNLTLSEVNVAGRDGVGGLVGYAEGDSKEIVNCHIISGEVSGGSYVGGLIGNTSGSGEIDNYYVKGCSTNITVRGKFGSIGGLIGSYRGSISDCCATGDVIAGIDGEQSTEVGGLIGYCTGYSSYENDGYHYYSTSNVVRCYATGNVTGNRSVGGLIGYQYYVTTTQCAAKGNVVGTVNVGGLIGEANAMSRRIKGEKTGYSHGNVLENSYARGSVTGMNYVGGLIGYNENTMVITNSYAAGKVEGIDNLGGLTGNTDGITITKSYYNGVVTPLVSGLAG